MVEDCKIYIRQERPEDYSEIRSLVKEAFAMAEHSDGDEHNLIDRIRMSDEYIPELSLVAVMDDAVVGHIMFSKILIGNETAIAPAPVSVSVGFQRMGIGKLLINTGQEIARALGYTCSVVLGSPDYYARFGYGKASAFGVVPPFDVNDEYYMVCRLAERDVPRGVVRYSKAFG